MNALNQQAACEQMHFKTIYHLIQLLCHSITHSVNAVVFLPVSSSLTNHTWIDLWQIYVHANASESARKLFASQKIRMNQSAKVTAGFCGERMETSFAFQQH